MQVQAACDAGTAKFKNRQYQKIYISTNINPAKFSRYTVTLLSVTCKHVGSQFLVCLIGTIHVHRSVLQHGSTSANTSHGSAEANVHKVPNVSSSCLLHYITAVINSELCASTPMSAC